MTTENTLLTTNGQGNTNAGEQGQQNAGGDKPGESGSQGDGQGNTPNAGNGQGGEGQGNNQAGEGSENKDGEGQVPEKYEFQMPEGVELDTVAAEEFTTIAKELKLSQADAAKVAEVGAKMALRQAEAHRATVAGWFESLKSDPDLGGDKLSETGAVAQAAVNAYGSKELKDILNSTGLGNHPAVVKAFYKIGKTLSPDALAQGRPNGGEQKDPAKIMFPTMN